MLRTGRGQKDQWMGKPRWGCAGHRVEWTGQDGQFKYILLENVIIMNKS